MSSPDYVSQKYEQAVSSLDTGEGTVQTRLVGAGLMLMLLRASDFPSPADAVEHAAIVDALTAFGAGGELGKLDVTAMETDDATANELERRIRALASRYPPPVDG